MCADAMCCYVSLDSYPYLSQDAKKFTALFDTIPYKIYMAPLYKTSRSAVKKFTNKHS